MRQRGFSLVEVLIAMAIATIVITGAMTAHVSNLRFFKTTETRSTLYQDSLLLIEYLRGELMAAGGGSVRSWMGIWVEDNCNPRGPLPGCQNSDRLTLTTLSIPLQECAITGQLAAAPLRLQIAFSGPGVCCMRPTPATNEIPFLNHQAMITLGDRYSQRFATVVDLNACQVTLAPGQASGNDQVAGLANWGNGVISLVDVETLYVDMAAQTLRRFADLNNNSVMDPGENVIVADNIFDTQYALGYDINPADGNVTESFNGVNDEWLFNAPGVVETFGAGAFAPPVSRSQLQLTQIGAIVGANDGSGAAPGTPAQSLNGPTRSQAGWYMMEEIARLSPRNSYIFQ